MSDATPLETPPVRIGFDGRGVIRTGDDPCRPEIRALIAGLAAMKELA